MSKLVHYRNKCIGCNSCVELAPGRWVIDADGKSTLVGAIEKNGIFVVEINDIELEQNEKAARDCPMRIIQVMQ